MQGDLFDGDIVKVAIERLRTFEPPEGYYLAFSGGKDSVAIKALADEAGVKYDAHYRLVPVDPPELIQFIREQHSDVAIDRCGYTLVELLVKKGFPLRNRRWCCAYFKEVGGAGRLIVTGIRAAESARRRNRRLIEPRRQKGKGTFLHAIIDWEDSDVWGYIRSRKIPYCTLYDEGWKRLGCVGCPMVRDTTALERWPKVLNVWKIGLRRWFNQKEISKARWSSFEVFWKAWLNRDGPMHGDIYESECGLFGSFGSEHNNV